ncbi:hypothetical protein GCM10018781_03010 [Kitasatospora indigofera]|uniref:Uncharacterized protein n=1 Tax=Kitasatospora indigofera TaxID=67307 RepID=A0A919FB55_9ACTN|nr:hypothetical protein [Kitasatospora indigofera]GHH59572.1 hypothetical protein GCM10018781_03010 [Kitasatospora indigofera]
MRLCRAKVHELIAAKQAGQEITAPEAAPAPGNVLDLMDILGRSLENAETAGSTSEAHEASAGAKSGRTATGTKAGTAAGRSKEDLSRLTKAELYPC